MPVLDHYSYSTLSLFEECPARAAWLKLEGGVELPSSALERGRVAHQAAEQYSWHCVRAREEFSLSKAAELAALCPDSQAAAIIATFGHQLRFDFAMLQADEVSVERTWRAELPSGDRLEGRVDRADYNEAEDELILTDYKTGSCWSFSEEPPRQLRLYGWAMRRQYPKAELITLRLMYLQSRTDREWVREADDEAFGDEWVQAWVDGVKHMEEFPEQPGSWCGYCGRARECANGRLVLAAELAPEEADLGEVAGHCLAWEAAAKQWRSLIDNWRRRDGLRVQVGNVERADKFPEWYERGQQRFTPGPKASVESVLDLLTAMGEPLSRYVRFDEGQLGKLLSQEIAPDSPGALYFADPQELADSPERQALRKLVLPVKPVPRACWHKVGPGEEDEDAIQDTEGEL